MTCKGIYGAMHVEKDSQIYWEHCLIEEILTDGPGTFLFLSDNNENPLIFKNNLFRSSVSKSSFIYIQKCYNISFENNIFIDNNGNLFNVYSSKLLAFNTKIANETCNFDKGCIFEIFMSSNIFLYKNVLENIRNSNEGGVYYVESSNLTIENESIFDCESDLYAACMLATNSFINYQYFYAKNFNQGCLYLTNSSIFINQSVLETNFMKSPQNLNFECFSSVCLFNCFDLLIENSVFLGNFYNTLYGGVIFFIIIKIFIFKKAIYSLNSRTFPFFFQIFNCTFTNNAAQKGGAIFLDNSGANLTNCIFSKNQAQDGGAIYFSSYSFSLFL